MRITAINLQIKRAGRYSIFVDQKYAFSLNEADVISSGLKLNAEISETDLENYKKQSGISKLFDNVLNYLAIRMRSEREIVDYIKRYYFKHPSDVSLDEIKEITSQITEKLHRYNYLNDTLFATTWVEERRKLKQRSNRLLLQELRGKGVEQSIIESVLKEGESTETDALKNLIQKKQRITRYQDPQKLKIYLLRQGFAYSQIKELIE